MTPGSAATIATALGAAGPGPAASRNPAVRNPTVYTKGDTMSAASYQVPAATVAAILQDGLNQSLSSSSFSLAFCQKTRTLITSSSTRQIEKSRRVLRQVRRNSLRPTLPSFSKSFSTLDSCFLPSWTRSCLLM